MVSFSAPSISPRRLISTATLFAHSSGASGRPGRSGSGIHGAPPQPSPSSRAGRRAVLQVRLDPVLDQARVDAEVSEVCSYLGDGDRERSPALP